MKIVMNKKNQKIEEFKVLLKFMDWSSKQFSDIYLNENSLYDLDESEYKKHHNKVKGQLKRASNTEKSTAIFITYINFIKSSDEFAMKSKEHSFKTFSSEFLASIETVVSKKQLKKVDTIYYEGHGNSSWSAKEMEDVLGCALQHAETIGSSSHDFQVVKLCDDGMHADYLVFWAGDIGFAGGSGTWGPAYCLVKRNHWGNYNIAAPGRAFYEHLKIIETVEFIESILHISGVTYGPTCHQRSPSYKLELQFRVVDSFVGTVDLELVDKKEIGYEDAS
ncbi:hypothetical protein C9J48_13835 [Photobacterium profundum]|uniref:Uncharacterized protein n=1 Tax=Photobacterium profundum 3TCK TaxID=314280 RepID=Q1Z6C9_9GAMM|nr:hypothetical protein [Photobacterium profundum]EAS44218.1 hypothetical protein P3TCK_11063 [Photobacterium profundum 3TCK]PSV62053.1 hypothetical protein C9J48_13835 [Photobacterium profundum]